MASTALHSALTPPTHFLRPMLRRCRWSCASIRCGPRDNRGPLVKGRILSTEAIQAIQSLKRAQRRLSSSSLPVADAHLQSLSRLIKSDLLAALRELLRQDECSLALHVLSTIRSEYPQPDLGLVADVVVALARNGMTAEIDRLVLEMGHIECGDEKALVRLIKGLIAAERKESTVRICGLMRESGIGLDRTVGEYVVKVLGRGLRRFGEEGLALEVERDFGGVTTITTGLEN